MTADAFTEVN